MLSRCFSLLVAVLALVQTVPAMAQTGLITKPSNYSAGVTLDRLEAALKERGFTIFTRIDHAAAAAGVELKMPAATVLVFGNPRFGTPSFLRQPSLAIDLPLKALVYEDAAGKVFIAYNSAEYVLGTIYGRHGVPVDPDAKAHIERVLAEATESAAQ
jgi:uncharacterized protein (DUF302 family)